MKASLSLWNTNQLNPDLHTCYLYYNELVTSVLQVTVAKNGQTFDVTVKQNCNMLVIKQRVSVTVDEAKKIALSSLQDVLVDMLVAVKQMTPC